ncbi:MAG: hypothetical protein R3C59_10910 [Planctomycetaceae bacterium]
MSLDIYLTGERVMSRDHSKPRSLVGERYNLGYWRNHCSLHDYIVEKVTTNIDDRREICLDETAIQQILKAIREATIQPSTEGFVGAYDPISKERDDAIFTDALQWLTETDEHASRFVVNSMSW